MLTTLLYHTCHTVHPRLMRPAVTTSERVLSASGQIFIEAGVGIAEVAGATNATWLTAFWGRGLVPWNYGKTLPNLEMEWYHLDNAFDIVRCAGPFADKTVAVVAPIWAAALVFVCARRIRDRIVRGTLNIVDL